MAAPLAASVPGAPPTWKPGSILRVFVGNGTAENPNAGMLAGNGYSYAAYIGACTTGACNGGVGGLIGNGGDGFAGGHGGVTALQAVPTARYRQPWHRVARADQAG